MLSMSGNLQEGIYYRAKPPIGNSFCIMSLRAENVTQISEIGGAVGRIWNILVKLKKGIIADLDIDSQHRKNGNLTVLLAYGYELFKIPGSQKERPANFDNIWNFKPPDSGGGGVLLDGAELTYSTKIFSNHLLTDHVLFQFIADNEFFTNRAAIEIWKDLHRLAKNRGAAPLRITGLYTGFQRADHRNWLGFHDGVSNIKSRERPHVISIGSRYLSPQDRWTLNGTYLAFMRIAFNLEKWEDTSITEQEILVGRDKLTGCPLISVDKNGKPVKDGRCPVPGTSEVIERGNEYFREHPPYGNGTQGKILQYSHIGRTRPIDQVPIWDKKSLRIYRQGFEFLTSSSEDSGLVAGLNFVSFQNTPERLYRALTYQHTRFQNSPGSTPLPNLDRFMSVLAAGIFFVPPKIQGEPFPGSGIFFNDAQLRNLPRNQW
jgi:deferrochelatase/peroxidase EfeB